MQHALELLMRRLDSVTLTHVLSRARERALRLQRRSNSTKNRSYRCDKSSMLSVQGLQMRKPDSVMPKCVRSQASERALQLPRLS